MHAGRIGHSANRYTKTQLVSPSSVKAAGQMWTDAMQMQDFDAPRELALHEIPGVVEEYAKATKNAFAAGFDGVELHSASGYLPMQFLSTNTNLRTDAYGGHVNNRIKFVVEVLEAMSKAAGSAGKVGIKISPDAVQHIRDDDPVETHTARPAISPIGLAYRTPAVGDARYVRAAIRFSPDHSWRAGITRETGEASSRRARLSSTYGKLFVSNPDSRPVRGNAAPADPTRFLGGHTGLHGLRVASGFQRRLSLPARRLSRCQPCRCWLTTVAAHSISRPLRTTER
jgi:N-ethylmaleimide reductase